MTITDCLGDYGWAKSETCAHPYLLPILTRALSNFNVAKDATVLDAGCGGGYVLSALFRDGYKKIWGFDLSETGIALAKKQSQEIAGNLAVHNGYASKLPDTFPQTGYSTVLSFEVIEHLINPGLYLKNISSWLGKEGYLVISTPYHGYLKNLAIAVLNKWDSHHTTDWEGGHIKFFSKKSLSALLTKCGFEPVAFYGAGRFPFLWKSMVVVAKKI